MIANRSRIAITGLGMALPLGVCDAGAFWNAVSGGMTAVRTHPLARGGETRAARMPAWNVDDVVDSRQTRRMSPLSKLAIAACRKALDGAGFASPPRKCPVFFASKCGSTEFLREFHEGMIGSGAGSPFLFTNGVANAPAGHISLEYGIQSPCFTLMGGASSAVVAIQHAAAMISDGADAALVGAAEELSDFFLASRAGFLASGSEASRAEASPPGEGGVFMVLEDSRRAEGRGAHVHAVIDGADFLRPDSDRVPAPGNSRKGQRFLSLSATDPSGLRAEIVRLGFHPPGMDGICAAAVKFNLGEAHAVSALAQTAVACFALEGSLAPRRPDSLEPPDGLGGVFPAEALHADFDSAVVSISDGQGPRGVVRLLRDG